MLVSASVQKKLRKFFENGVLQDFQVEYANGVLTVTILSDDVEMGWAAYTVSENDEVEVCEENGIDAYPTTFDPSHVKPVLDAFAEWKPITDWVASVKFLKSGLTRGSMELALQGIGIVYMEFRIVTHKGSPRIQLTKSSAFYNKDVRLKSGVRRL